MDGFVSYSAVIKEVVTAIIKEPKLHARWINTLSFLENCGAKKIAVCEDKTRVKEEMLKHAAEEFRHAHYLKRQIQRLNVASLETYESSFLLGRYRTRHYLDMLDLMTCRFLKEQKHIAQEVSYLLVTYAIELRAQELYPLYEALLRNTHSPITVRSILLEEKEHLAEMERALADYPEGYSLAKRVSAIESALCDQWIKEINCEVIRHYS